jgi:hypothetical protein
MSKASFIVGVALMAASAPAPDEKPKPGYAKKDGLSVTVTLDKKSYGPADEIVLQFALKNESDKLLFVGDGHLAPDYHEAGPGRHFEVYVKSGGKDALSFWSGLATAGDAAGVRKVFKLKPGEEYKGSIRLSAGVEKDGQRYTVELRYQIDPDSHGVREPPTEFKDELLWKGSLTTAPIEFEVSAK